MNKWLYLIAILSILLAGCSADNADMSANSTSADQPAGEVAVTPDAAAAQPVAFGQDKSPEAIYIIFDASGSMMGQLPDRSRKIATAKQVLQNFVSGDFEGYELALRALS